MTDQAFATVDAQWLSLMSAARDWFATPLGKQMLQEEQRLLREELARFFGGYLVHYGPPGEFEGAGQIRCSVRLGPPLPGVQIVCEEQAWPLTEHAADVVVLQHALDFSLSPHALLREAARSVRPGGHLLVVGINPRSLWGLRRHFAGDVLRQARCIGSSRVGDWLALLGFALEKRRFGCYRPPFSSSVWQSRTAHLESWGESWRMPGGGFYLLVVRKLVVGLRPLPQNRREPIGKLLPLPVVKVSRRASKHGA
ncbi:Methyltransferase domain-containing protein [Azotobacter beijerinckii]|uniref:Methyltransferase domain-containing protein n=1 Tax=Azotobacter beijerinckii TaxID=170623 RepID=A0A1H9L6V9_9GAMM|nr:methyltransferase domain-containing protein [Azotobacter beijerinckii]SER07166.1 Methyltransferase domain-containing protein [Azotobacter beijerinckii]